MSDELFAKMLTLYVNDYDIDDLILMEADEANKAKIKTENVEQSQNQTQTQCVGMSVL